MKKFWCWLSGHKMIETVTERNTWFTYYKQECKCGECKYKGRRSNG